MSGERVRAILLPGGVLPAEPAYAGLVATLGPDVEAVPKDLELYRDPQPPAAYGLEVEVDGVRRDAERLGWPAFHLVAYSAGAAVALAVAARAPELLLSLAITEPAWAGNEGMSPEEAAAQARFGEIMELPPPERMEAFFRAQVRDDVPSPPPPEGPPPHWMERRPVGLAALTAAFDRYDLDVAALRRFDRPVLYALGARSKPQLFERRAQRLGTIFPRFTLEVFEERHHFDPPHRGEPERLAASLRRLWVDAAAG